MPNAKKLKHEYPCTQCGGDAFVGMSDWKDYQNDKQLIGKKERLCMKCARARGTPDFNFQSSKTKEAKNAR